MPNLTCKLLNEKYPDFVVTSRRGHGCGQRYYVTHKPTGFWACCILTKLDSTEHLIQRFDADKYNRGFWRPPEERPTPAGVSTRRARG